MAYNKIPAGPTHPLFKTGKKTDSFGYVVLTSKVWGDYCGKREHQMVAEQMLGRPLAKGEHVHHINGIKHDNRPENLQVVPSAEHRRIHGNGSLKSCRCCGKERWYSKSEAARLADDYACRECRPSYKKVCLDCSCEFQGHTGSKRCKPCARERNLRLNRERARKAKIG